MKDSWIGLDIGGANLKSASDSKSQTQPFELWKHPALLAQTLELHLSHLKPFTRLAVTMTGELADCFESKQHGVKFICDCVNKTFASYYPVFYQTSGKFVDSNAAKQDYLLTAASNWHALASAIAIPLPNCLVLDIGSTTTDIIPIINGQVASKGKTDLQRLSHFELLYTGLSRTPLSALATQLNLDGQLISLAAEAFATTKDVYLVLERIADCEKDTQTADGRAATKTNAYRRLAKMVCSDVIEIGTDCIKDMASQLAQTQFTKIANCVASVADRQKINCAVAVGEGDWLAKEILESCERFENILTLKDLNRSVASISGLPFVGPAWAVKTLAELKVASVPT